MYWQIRPPENKLRFQNKQGFSLIETIIALFVTIIVIQMFTLTAPLLKAANQQRLSSNKVAFCYVQLENFLSEKGGFEIDKKKSTATSLAILKQTKDSDQKEEKLKLYRIEHYKEMVRITGASRGHLPLLLDVKNLNFEVQSKFFVMQITEKDGRVSELLFKTAKQKES